MTCRQARYEAVLAELLEAVRQAGPAGLRLSDYAALTRTSVHTLQCRMQALAQRQQVAVLAGGRVQSAAPRARDARWIIRPLSAPTARPERRKVTPWPWERDRHARRVAAADPDAIERQLYDARLLYEAAMGRV